MLEAVARGQRPRRHCALPLRNDLRHVAVQEAQGEAWDGREGRAVQSATERLGERRVGDRLGRRAVDGPLPVRIVKRREVEPDDVVDVDPRHVLAATGDRAADAELEGRQHRLEGSAARVEDDPCADEHDAQAERLGRQRLALPGDAHVGEEVAASGRALVDALVAVLAVEADGGRGEQHAGTRVGGADAGDEVACAELTALADRRLHLGAPALCDGLAREVDHGIATGERRNRRGAGERLPGDGVDPELTLRTVRVAGEHGHLVAPLLEGGDESAADEAGGSGDGHVHGRRSFGGRSC